MRSIHIRFTGEAVTDTGAVLGYVMVQGKILVWDAPEAHIEASTMEGLKAELAGVYGASVTCSQWWDIPKDV